MAYRGVEDSKANASKLSTAHTQRTGGPTVDRVRKEQLKGGLFGNAPKGPLRHEDEEEEEALGKLNGVGSKKATAQNTKASDNPTDSISDADLAESLKLLEQLGSTTQATASTSGTATGIQTKPSHTNSEPQSQRRVIGTHPSLDEGQADWSKLESMQPTNSKVPSVSSKPQPVKANKKEEDDEEEEEALPGVSRQKLPVAATTRTAPARNAPPAPGSSSTSSSTVETTATPQTATVGGSSKPIAQPLLHVPRAAREVDEEAEEEEEGEEDAEIQFVPKNQRGRTDGDKMHELRQSIVASKQMALGFATNERKVVSLDQVSGASAVDDTDRPNDPVEWEAFLARRKEREVRLRGILGSS